MIVQPGFLQHFKVRKLVTITGNKAAPLALINLWGHCQVSRRWEFPDLRRDDLASICEWDSKFSCEKALIACGFIEKISGGGYLVRGWEEHNKNLINNWKRNPSGKPSGESDTDPTGTPRAPHHEPDQIDPIRSDRPDQKEKTKPDPIQPDPSATPAPLAAFSAVLEGLDRCVRVNVESDGDRDGVEGLGPSLEKALAFGKTRYPDIWEDAETWVRAWFKTMSEAHWLDRKRNPIADWQKNLVAYVDVCWRGKPKRKERCIPNI